MATFPSPPFFPSLPPSSLLFPSPSSSFLPLKSSFILQPPMGTIDLMECVSPLPITIISREICARPNTFALETIRPGKAGETETLVLKRSHDRKNTMVERLMVSADTKEVNSNGGCFRMLMIESHCAVGPRYINPIETCFLYQGYNYMEVKLNGQYEFVQWHIW